MNKILNYNEFIKECENSKISIDLVTDDVESLKPDNCGTEECTEVDENIDYISYEDVILESTTNSQYPIAFNRVGGHYICIADEVTFYGNGVNDPREISVRNPFLDKGIEYDMPHSQVALTKGFVYISLKNTTGSPDVGVTQTLQIVDDNKREFYVNKANFASISKYEYSLRKEYQEKHGEPFSEKPLSDEEMKELAIINKRGDVKSKETKYSDVEDYLAMNPNMRLIIGDDGKKSFVDIKKNPRYEYDEVNKKLVPRTINTRGKEYVTTTPNVKDQGKPVLDKNKKKYQNNLSDEEIEKTKEKRTYKPRKPKMVFKLVSEPGKPIQIKPKEGENF